MTKRRTIIGVVVVAAALLLWLWSPAPGLQGKLRARIDVARGHYKVLFYGYGSPARPEFARIIQERYGIEYDEVAGDMVSRRTVAYADGYNSVIVAAVTRKFGRDVIKEAQQEAQKHWEEKERARTKPQKD